MATAPPPAPIRHALNWPAGSIRALLGLGVLLCMWVLALGYKGSTPLLNDEEAGLFFVSLQFLMVLILTHYYSAHRHGPVGKAGSRSPLGLPRGTIRLILVVGQIGLLYFLYLNPDKLQFPTKADGLIRQLLVLAAGYFLGYVITAAMGMLYPVQLPAWFLDVQAWFALIGMMLMGILVLGWVINAGMDKIQIDFKLSEAILAGIVGFYFGARS